MNTDNLSKNPIGKCCDNTSEYIVEFNGTPSENYSVYLCSLHLNKKPFDRNIRSIRELKNELTIGDKKYE